MSCGRPHETPCTEVLDRVYDYIDGEIDSQRRAKIKQHLEECGPCLKEYGLEEAVKAIVKRSCEHERVPEDLRTKVLAKIANVRDRLAGEAAEPSTEVS